MAGIFSSAPLFVYHCSLVPGSAESERFKVMERRLLKQIMARHAPHLAVRHPPRPHPGIVDWGHFNWWHVKS